MPIFDGLGRSLRWLRERQVKRQYQVAEGAGITKAMLSAYETGKQKPSLDTLEKILDALVCDLNDLHNALQIVNGRPDRMRHAGSGRDHWRSTDRAPEGGTLQPDLYEILGADEPLPSQEEQAMSEMLGGFHKLLRYMHARVPRAAPATPPASGGPSRPTAVPRPADAAPASSEASGGPGTSGAPRDSGTSGASGTSRDSGTSGRSGAPGSSGTSGPGGTSDPGPSGTSGPADRKRS